MAQHNPGSRLCRSVVWAILKWVVLLILAGFIHRLVYICGSAWKLCFWEFSVCQQSVRGSTEPRNFHQAVGQPGLGHMAIASVIQGRRERKLQGLLKPRLIILPMSFILLAKARHKIRLKCIKSPTGRILKYCGHFCNLP